MTSTKTFLSILAAGFVLCAASIADAQRIRVTVAPPAPRVEAQPVAPWGGAVWQPGYWHWNGRSWSWRNGRWMRPRRGYAYSHPRWVDQGGVWVYQPGGWRRERGAVVVVGHDAPQPPVVVVQQPGVIIQQPGVVIDRRGRRGRTVVVHPGQAPGTVVIDRRGRRGRTVVVDPGRRGGVVEVRGRGRGRWR